MTRCRILRRLYNILIPLHLSSYCCQLLGVNRWTHIVELIMVNFSGKIWPIWSPGGVHQVNHQVQTSKMKKRLSFTKHSIWHEFALTLTKCSKSLTKCTISLTKCSISLTKCSPRLRKGDNFRFAKLLLLLPVLRSIARETASTLFCNEALIADNFRSPL